MSSLPELLKEGREIEAMIATIETAEDAHNLDLAISLQENLIDKVLQKVDAYNYVLEKLNTNADFWAQKAKEYAEQAKLHKKRAERFKQQVMFVMQANELEELEGETCKFKLQRSPPKLDVIDEGAIPHSYFTEVVSTELDTARLKQDLLNGKEIDGARIVENKHVRSYLK